MATPIGTGKNRMIKNGMIAVLVIIVLLFAAAFLMRGPSQPTDVSPPPATSPEQG
jgi:hypothetical protein